MPKRYEAIKRTMLLKGLALKEAKTRAAKIFNATRKPGARPVTGKWEKRGEDD